MLSPKELLRDDIAKVSINYDTIINGQEESSAALSSSPGKEGWLFRRIEPEWRHDYFRDNEISNHVLRYCKVWVAMYDGRLLFSDFFSNDASVLALFNKSCASTSQVQFKNRTGSPSYIANVVGSFFNRRDSTNENESVKTTFSVSSGRSGGAGGTRCFGYLDISTGIEFKVIHKDPTEGNSEYDQFFAFEVREGDLSIEFATRTEMERQDWIEKIRECLNGKVHVLPNSSLRLPVPARARLEDASRLALLSSAGSIDKGVFPQKSGFLMKSSFNSTSSPLQSTTISFDTVDMTDLNADNAVPARVGKSKALGVLSTNISPSSPSKIWKGLKAKAGLTRRRWFVLKAGQLLYYNTELNCSEVSGGGDGLLSKGATINLNYASVWRDPDNGKSFVLYLLLENGRCMRLEATSSEEADDWFDCLNETITLLQRYSFFHDDSSKTGFVGDEDQPLQRRFNIHDRFDVSIDGECGIDDTERGLIEIQSSRESCVVNRRNSTFDETSIRSQSLDDTQRSSRIPSDSSGKPVSDKFTTSSRFRSQSTIDGVSGKSISGRLAPNSRFRSQSTNFDFHSEESHRQHDFAIKNVVPSPSTVNMIKSCLSCNFLVQAAIIDGDDADGALQQLVDVMQQRILVPGEVIMWEGTSGNDYYVLEEGCCDVIKKGEKIARVHAGNGFGELALLNNSTRQATIRASSYCRLWRLTRSSFRHVAAIAEARKLNEKINFLQNIEIFQQLMPEVLIQIADVMQLRMYDAGDKIIRQGDSGDSYYMIVSGRVVVSQKKGIAGSSIELARLGPGKGFGDLALFKDAPRAATVVASTAVTCWTVDRLNFLNLVGSMEEVVHESRGLRMLQQVKLLQPLTSQQLRSIARRLVTVEYAQDDVIIKQGDVGDNFFMISRGEVGVQVNHVQVATLEEGSFFGEMSLLTNERRSATVVALCECQCLVLCRTDFDELLGPLDDIIQFEAQRRKDHQNLAELAKEKSIGRASFMGSLRRMSDSIFASNSSHPVACTGNDSGHTVKNLDAAITTVEADMVEKVFALSIPSTSLFAQTNTIFRNDFDSFLRVRRLGFGTFSTVFLVRHEQTGKFYAMKMQHKQHLLETRQEMQCSYSERNIMLVLADSQFVATLYSTVQDAKSIYFIQQFVPGPDLWTYLYGKSNQIKRTRSFDKESSLGTGSNFKLKRMASGMSSRLLGVSTSSSSSGLTAYQCQFYAANVLTALSHIHEKEIVYRNIKPENMVIDSGGYLKIIDFGSAKKLRMGGKTHTLCGTAEYCAPEIVLGRGHDFAVDYWGLGVFIFELFCRTTPFVAPTTAQIFQNIVESEKWVIPLLLQSMQPTSFNGKSRKTSGTLAVSSIPASPDSNRSPYSQKSFSPPSSSPQQEFASNASQKKSPIVAKISALLTAASLSIPSKEIIGNLLAFKPNARLGMLRDGVDDIWKSPFFKGLSREAVERRQIGAPFIPEFDEEEIQSDSMEDVLDVIEDSDDYPDYIGDFDYSFF